MMETNTEFKQLTGQDEYTRYFNQLSFIFEKLREFSTKTGQKADQQYESLVISEFLSKMLYTIKVLRKKHTYNPNHSLKVDLSDSGLPSFWDIDQLNTDVLNKADRLSELPTMQSLKKEMLDFMFKYKQEPLELLCKASERSYYEMLDKDQLFLSFTPGEIKARKEKEKFRTFTFSWACYDFATNRPYLHIMMFEQDRHVPFDCRQFLEIVQSEGSRAPDIGIIALGIDSNIRDVHPKVLKRICIGPIYSNEFSRNPENFSKLLELEEYEDDFILLFEDEIIMSKDQQVSRSLFSFGQLREIFYIPETDMECYTRKASMIHKYMLLPHAMLQYMDFKESFKEYNDHEVITYDKKGGIYVN